MNARRQWRFQLYLIEILHQTTTAAADFKIAIGCILLKFYIKPQRKIIHGQRRQVVSYWNSTSNHNTISNNPFLPKLYLIEILHQTTTRWKDKHKCSALYLIEILHQTTTQTIATPWFLSCILLKFYIKPQPGPEPSLLAGVVSYWNSTSNHNTRALHSAPRRVVSYWNSTSNHNNKGEILIKSRLYLIEILHQTTT